MRNLLACSFILLLLSPISSPQSLAAPESKRGTSRRSHRVVQPMLEPKVGVFIGNFILLDKNQTSIFVQPANRDGPKQRFYYDSKTIFDQEKKKIALTDIPIGSFIAVKYFGTGKILVADVVNVLPSDIEITDERVKRWMRGERGTFGDD